MDEIRSKTYTDEDLFRISQFDLTWIVLLTDYLCTVNPVYNDHPGTVVSLVEK